MERVSRAIGPSHPLFRFMHIEYSLRVRAPAHRIFRIYSNVEGWHLWDPETRNACLNGPFAVGTTGTLTPTKGRAVPMLLTEVDPFKAFTVQSRVPLMKLIFEHQLDQQGEHVNVTHRATFSGPLSLIVGRMLLRRLERTLPLTLANLKALAEQAP